MALSFLGPADRADLLRGFEALSPRSRYLRFFSRMPTLPDFIVDGLLNTDGSDHVAIGARLIDANGAVEPAVVGVARYFRAEPGAPVAEPAVAVVDRLHGLGLGRLLLRRLTEVARAQGISHYRAHALADNTRIRRILQASRGTIVEQDGPLLIYDIDIRPGAARRDRLRRLLGALFGH